MRCVICHSCMELSSSSLVSVSYSYLVRLAHLAAVSEGNDRHSDCDDNSSTHVHSHRDWTNASVNSFVGETFSI
jgi:hypothetical protein